MQAAYARRGTAPARAERLASSTGERARAPRASRRSGRGLLDTTTLILLRSSPRRSGRKTSARAYDAMIAAIALANDLPVYTCNAADFSGIAGLDVVAVSVSRTT
jgi:hypothetical protein